MEGEGKEKQEEGKNMTWRSRSTRKKSRRKEDVGRRGRIIRKGRREEGEEKQ